MKTTLVFDKEALYEEKIAPLVKEIYDICFENRMPFFCCVTVKSEAGKPAEYKRDGFCARTFCEDIENDEIGRHLAVAAGFGVNTSEELVIEDDMFENSGDELGTF